MVYLQALYSWSYWVIWIGKWGKCKCIHCLWGRDQRKDPCNTSLSWLADYCLIDRMIVCTASQKLTSQRLASQKLCMWNWIYIIDAQFQMAFAQSGTIIILSYTLLYNMYLSLCMNLMFLAQLCTDIIILCELCYAWRHWHCVVKFNKSTLFYSYILYLRRWCLCLLLWYNA